MVEYYIYDTSLDVFESGKGFYLYKVNHKDKTVHFMEDGFTSNRKKFINMLDLLLSLHNKFSWYKSAVTYESFLNQKDNFELIDLQIKD